MYDLKVIETNEIAGETVECLVTVSRHRTMRTAREAAEKRWGGDPPKNARITCDGVDYSIRISFPEIL